MGNNQQGRVLQQQQQVKKVRKRDSIKQLYRWMSTSRKDFHPFPKLDKKILTIIASFISISDMINLQCVSRSALDTFQSVSSPYQVECQKHLNLQYSEYIISSKWKVLLKSLYCTSLKGIPFAEAIKSVKYPQYAKPLLVEHATELSNFQKSILYYENLESSPNNSVSEWIMLNEARQFCKQHSNLVLKLRLGEEINIQMPDLLMIIYTMQDFIKIYLIYIAIRMEECTMEEFLDLWTHYSGWIRTLEDASAPYVQLFNTLLQETFNSYQMPKFSTRHFMVQQWMKCMHEALKLKLRHVFSIKMKECRIQGIKCKYLKEYVQYLLNTNTNQLTINKYGHSQFEYSNQIEALLKVCETQSEQLYQQYSMSFQKDEQIIIYIFGELLYKQRLFDYFLDLRLQSIKTQLKQIIHKRISVTAEPEMETDHPISFLQQFCFNPTEKIKSLIQQLSQENVKDVKDIEDENSGSLETSNYSHSTSTGSGIFSSFKFKGVDHIYTHIKVSHSDIYNELSDFYIKQNQINCEIRQLNLQIEDSNMFHKSYDFPILCDYEQQISFGDLLVCMQKKKEKPKLVLLQEEDSKFENVFGSNMQSLAATIMQQHNWFTQNS